MVCSNAAIPDTPKGERLYSHLNQSVIEDESTTRCFVGESFLNVSVFGEDIARQGPFPIVDEIDGLRGGRDIQDWKNGAKDFFLHCGVVGFHTGQDCWTHEEVRTVMAAA